MSRAEITINNLKIYYNTTSVDIYSSQLQNLKDTIDFVICLQYIYKLFVRVDAGYTIFQDANSIGVFILMDQDTQYDLLHDSSEITQPLKGAGDASVCDSCKNESFNSNVVGVRLDGFFNMKAQDTDSLKFNIEEQLNMYWNSLIK